MLKPLSVAAAMLGAAPALAGGLVSPHIDQTAPAFVGAAANGDAISLDQFKGQLVVLEWTNDGCPFVRKHYDSGNMQATQKIANDDGVVWITVMSSAPGKQGHADATRASSLVAGWNSGADYVLLDESGEVGRAYGAKTTPQMALIDRDGVLRYQGAIDDKPSTDPKTVDGATNYLLAALESVKAGEPIAVKETKPYGCSVKYGS